MLSLRVYASQQIYCPISHCQLHFMTPYHFQGYQSPLNPLKGIKTSEKTREVTLLNLRAQICSLTLYNKQCYPYQIPGKKIIKSLSPAEVFLLRRDRK